MNNRQGNRVLHLLPFIKPLLSVSLKSDPIHHLPNPRVTFLQNRVRGTGGARGALQPFYT